MIQKNLKKWYPTKEREEQVKKQEESRAMVQRMIRASEQMNRLTQNGRYGSANYVVDLTYMSDITSTTVDPVTGEIDLKSPTLKMFKKDFGEWKWSNFWYKLIIFGVLSLVFSISHRLINGPLKLNDGSFCPFYLEILFAQMLHLGVASLFWVLEKLWYIKAYTSAFIKLGLSIILVLPIVVICSLLQKQSIGEKITGFWADKCFTKKESEILDKYIKEI